MSKADEIESLQKKYTACVTEAFIAGENLLQAAGKGPAAIVVAKERVDRICERRDAIEAQLRALGVE